MSCPEQKEKLRAQLREAYGRIVYSNTTHLKAVDKLILKNNRMKSCQIALSAITTGGFLSTFIINEGFLKYVTGLASVLSLGLNIYLKNFELDTLSKEHQIAANDLWLIREKYISLLTDMDDMTIDQIIATRDMLQDDTHNVYKTSPKTDADSYAMAQKALKTEEEQFFTDEELNQILPKHLRIPIKKEFLNNK